MKGGQSAARQHRRAMKEAGVAVAVRVVVPTPVARHTIDSALMHAMFDLERNGADMSSRIAITIGDDHPNFPGRTVVEAKAAASVAPRPSFDYAADAADNDRDDAGS